MYMSFQRGFAVWMWTYLYLLCYSTALGILYQSMLYPYRLSAQYNQIPDFTKQKLRSIWKSYKSGTSCVAEQIATDVILTIADIFSTKYHDEEKRHSMTARSSIMKPKFTFDDTQQHLTYLIPRYSTSYQKLISNMISSVLHQKRSEPQKHYYSEDSIYIDDDTINLTTTTKTSSELHNNPSGYNSASNRISTILIDEAVYDEVPIPETFELPEFLKDASKDVISNFTKVWTDPNIPSENLRKEMIHLLAVSLLNRKQLTAYNEYVSERRRCQRQLLIRVRRMSDEARKALKILIYADPNEQFALIGNFPRIVQRELRNFARQKIGKCA